MNDGKAQKSKEITCPNTSCRKVFTVPLKTLNLQSPSAVKYDSCPYCLTKIIVADPKLDGAKTEKALRENTVETGEISSTCHYHLGYLSERSQKERIPDECIVCNAIVECMLRKMRE